MRRLSGLVEPVSIFLKFSDMPNASPAEWTKTDLDGLPVFQRRVNLEESRPILSMTLPHRIDPRLFLIDVDSSTARSIPWIWFVRDYFGSDPILVRSPTRETSHATAIALVSDLEEMDVIENITIVTNSGEVSQNVFRVLERHEALGPVVQGAAIPFNGEFRPIELEGFRSVVVDEAGRPCVAVRSSPSKSVVFGFDPVSVLARDSRDDVSAESAALNANWLPIVMRSVAWAAPFVTWKGFWPADIPPLIYTVDTEAGSGYYDPNHNACVWSVGRRLAFRRTDMKTEASIRTAAKRLGRYGLVGSFFVDLNGIHDNQDLEAIKEVAKENDISLHLPRIGNHEAWKSLISDPDATSRALGEAVGFLSQETGPPIGFRYPSWQRGSATHDLLAAANLGYDSSSLAHGPFLTVPYRMFSSTVGAPLNLWEFACHEVIGAVKAGPHLLQGVRTRRSHAIEVAAYLNSCASLAGLAVLCDHDMSLGAARGHVHGTWRVDMGNLKSILRSARGLARLRKLRPLRGSDFLRWWTLTRALRLVASCERAPQGWNLTVAIRGAETGASSSLEH